MIEHAAVVLAFVLILAMIVLLLGLIIDFAARVARYRAYRNRYPSARFGDIWRHVR